MGTRGAAGFFVDGIEKIAYTQYDSYPSSLGKNVLTFLSKQDINAMREATRKIQLVTNDIKPTGEQKIACVPYTNLSVSEQTTDDWYCLLRGAQGELEPYMNDLHLMLDSKDFLKDSLFCEYAYLINLDTEKLEFYKGFNKNPEARGRYASRKESREYYGVALALEIPLAEINPDNVEQFVVAMEKVDKEENAS